MCVFIYLCMYVFMQLCMYLCVYVFMHVGMYVCMYVRVGMYDVCMHICMYVCMCVYVCMYVCCIYCPFNNTFIRIENVYVLLLFHAYVLYKGHTIFPTQLLHHPFKIHAAFLCTRID